MDNCKNCDKPLKKEEKMFYFIGFMNYIVYCKDCYNKRIEKEKQIWKDITTKPHF